MENSFQLRELISINEMVEQLPTLRHMYPTLTADQYTAHLDEMLPNHYYQVAAFDREVCAGLSGYWINTKIYSGKYLEIDNLVVAPSYRSKGIGKLLTDWMENRARSLNCKAVMLDAYVENFRGHNFYRREGYKARGYHFIKPLQKGIFPELD